MDGLTGALWKDTNEDGRKTYPPSAQLSELVSGSS